MPLEDCLDALDDALGVDPALREKKREKDDDTGRRRIEDQSQHVFGDEEMTLHCKNGREESGRLAAFTPRSSRRPLPSKIILSGVRVGVSREEAYKKKKP